MDILEIKLLAFKQLEEDCKNTEEHGSYTAEDMLEYFIGKNEYNPNTEIEILKEELLTELFKKASDENLELNFYKIKGVSILDNIDRFRDFEKEIVSNFNHCSKSSVFAIKSFLLKQATK